MATRLEITHGLISERDRLPDSADTLSVTRPSTGSQTRTKGVLYVVVSSTVPGARAREATRLVADTLRREYYYDESAGVPVCLEKAIRGADRRVRSSREGAGLGAGTIGVGVAVVRNNEVYLATVGPVEAYLVRSARLLMPDRRAAPGLPAEEGLAVEVWRGELSVGDALLLVSRNVTETIGSEELKSATLTLHPQAAAEHLHHLFVAAGGEGPDGLITVEASEQTTRITARAMPLPTTDVHGDLPGMLPRSVSGSVGTSVLGMRGSFEDSIRGFTDRLWDALPRRETRAYELDSSVSRAETQRRAAIGVMALVGVIALLGLFVILVPRGGEAPRIAQVATGDSALTVALDRTERADNLTLTEPAAALEYYREAWAEIERARQTGLSAPDLDALEARVRSGLDGLYGARAPQTRLVTDLAGDADPVGLVQDSRGGALFIDRATTAVSRVNVGNGKGVPVVVRGDRQDSGGKATIGRPMQIEAGGPDVVIVDDEARPWRWRPSNGNGDGTLAKLTLLDNPTLGEDHGDVAAYSPSTGGYRLYVVEPSRDQIMRYQQTLDGSAFQAPGSYLVTPSAEVAEFEQLYVDFDVYALIDNGLRRYRYEKYDGAFAIEEPPDASDVRRGHDYRIVAGSGGASDGTLYLYDERWGRIVGFSKEDGSYVGQWVPGPDDPQMTDVRGMYVVPGKRTKKKQAPDTLYWINPDGLYESVLVSHTPEPSSGGSGEG